MGGAGQDYASGSHVPSGHVGDMLSTEQVAHVSVL